MEFKRIPERAMRIGLGAPIPIKFIGTDLIQDSFEKGVFEQAERVAYLPHIADLAFMPDAHIGIGTCIGTMAAWKKDKALVSPTICGVDIGCGMRLVRTSLTPDAFDKHTLRLLMDKIEERIPMGAGKKVEQPVDSDRAIRGAILGHLPRIASVLGQTERSVLEETVPGSYTRILPDGVRISERAWERGYDTLGTLGGGNHFIEIQVVKVLEPAIAAKWDLFDNQIVVEIHSGSRGFGYQIADDYMKFFGDLMDRQGITRVDKGLVYAAFNSDHGQDYFTAQRAACNFSVLNRLIMSYHVKEVLRELMGVTGSDLCDIIHNYIVEEDDYLVHRKGATAAYPAGHPIIKDTPFEDTGFPMLIPGSMGTASFILQPLEGAKETRFTVNHGAGRTMSRRQAQEGIATKRFESQMSQILVNERDLSRIKDEAPDAYKDIDEVIKSVEMAGLARVVARCTPIAVMKGSDIEFRRRRKR
ncbi:MAG TPA: RtcB family protein [Firmicutes bacterium]|nr:RtcB family protein [Candidatus Fermentithermobacillaceae bacterium]